MAHYTKLWSHILNSTIWSEDDHTRLVWITMLAMSDPGGYVAGSVPGLAHQARVPIESCEAALNKFRAPDPYSRTKEHDGRRIKDVDGGWQILNYEKHRQAVAEERRKNLNRERARRFRDKKRNAKSNAGNAHVAPPCAKVTTRQKAEGRRQKAEVILSPPKSPAGGLREKFAVAQETLKCLPSKPNT